MQVGENINNHTNTFEGGMNKDVSVLLQPDGTYRDLRNFQLINHDGNNYTIKDALGNRLIFTLPFAYNAIIANKQLAPMPIGFISFPDRLIVFHTNSESSSGGYGEIGELYLTNVGQSIATNPQTIIVGVNTWTFDGYKPLYNHVSLAFSKMYKIEGFSFPENDTIGRIYWTDNFNEPRVLDTLNPIYTTYFATGGLVTGNQYMVISGAITHNSTNYGVGLTAGNVFTAINANYVVADGQPLVIAYFPYQLLSWQPSRSMGNMSFNQYGNGVKRVGSNVYFHRLGKRSDGYFTSWSYGSAPMHVGVPNVTAYLSGNTYQDFVGDGSATTVVVSAKSIQVDITNIDTNFDVIQLASAEYTQSYTVPYSISIVAEATITGATMTMEDFGNVNLGNLTTNDITLFPASILKCKTITTNKNYNIIANITERKELTFDNSSISISAVQYPMIVHGVDGTEAGASCTNGYVPVNTLLTASLTANPAATTIRPFSRWLVIFGDNGANTVTYNAVQYTTGQVITGIVGQVTITFAGTGSARPCVNINRYNVPINASAAVTSKPNAVQLKTGFWDYKDPAVTSMVKGYWSHETYRFGILFLDKKGNPFYVRWLGDYQLPEIVTKGGLMRQDTFLATNSWSLNPSIININGLELPQNIVDNIDGFSIVRAPRDIRIVTQGLLVQNNRTGGSPDTVYPIDYIANNYQLTADNIYTWICPDDLVGLPEKQTIAVAGDKMEEACWLSALTWNNTSLYRSGNGNYDVFAKLFIPTTDASSGSNLRIATILNWAELNENDVITNVFSIPNFDYHNIFTNTGGGNLQIDTTCGTVPVGNIPMGGYVSVGGKKALIYMNGIPHYGQYPAGYDYSVTAVANVPNNPTKLVMNYVKNLTNPYGGTGQSAIANTLYISTGHYQPITSSVLTDVSVLKFVLTSKVGTFLVGEQVTGGTSGATGFIASVIGNNVYLVPSGIIGVFVNGETITGSLSGATGVISSQATVYLFNGIQVGGGDCFTNLVDYGYGLYNVAPPTASVGYYFPCEGNANYGLRRGRKISNKGMGIAAPFPAGVSFVPTRLEDFSYNPAFSTEGAQFLYPALPVNFLNTGRFPTRARFAGQKIIGEIIDSFRKFLVNDYRDVDVQLGEINNLMAKGDYVYYLQNHGVGSMPILERILNSGTTGAVTSLGTGGVLSRFDTLSTKYGNQHQWSLIPTEDGWIWFDMRNKDVCVMGFGSAVQEITVPTGMKSYFNEVFLERLTSLYTDTYLNSQTYAASSDRPLLGTGIVGVYDPKNKMTYITFKFRSYYKNSVSPVLYTDYQVLNKDFTIGFSHVINKFVGFYDAMPSIWHNHNQSVLSANNPKNPDIYYAADMIVPTPIALGNVVKDGMDEYICTTAGTISVYASPPSGSLFTKVNSTNEIYIDNEVQPYSAVISDYQYNKRYGKVVDNSVTFVVNPKTEQGFAVDNQLQVGNGVNFNQFYYNTDTKSASDNDVKDWNRNYQLIDEGWNNNLPISTTGKLSGFYNMVKYVKKNWTTVPTTVTTSVKILQKVKSFFKLKF